MILSMTKLLGTKQKQTNTSGGGKSAVNGGVWRGWNAEGPSPVDGLPPNFETS